MNKNLGRFSRNASEEIRLLLREVHGELHVELRAYGRSTDRTAGEAARSRHQRHGVLASLC